jgi:hypothetical protein
MESAICRTVSTFGLQPNTKLVVLNKPTISEDGEYQKFLNELHSYCCGYWKWLRKRRIREVFVVGNVRTPEIGKIDKVRIKRKTEDFIELTDGRRFDITTGRSFCGEPGYIFPLENRRVCVAWEPQSLRQRVERAFPKLGLDDVRTYADELLPNWHLGLFDHAFTGAADSLSEREAASMASSREFAKKAIFGHLPGNTQEFRALVEMMEHDAK